MYQSLAAIDIGSNTVHLIVAATDGEHIALLADESIFVRLASGVWSMGAIPEERIVASTQALLHLRDVARGYGAQRIIVVATEVARAAKNTSSLLQAIQATSGLEPLVLSGLDEATLTFRGVTHGRHLPANVAVADLGGGSLEIILAELGHGAWRTSLPVGSSFMHDRFVSSDPPQPDEVAVLRAHLADAFAAVPKLGHIEEVLVCGGTVNALMRLVQQAEGRAVGDRVLRRADLDHALGIMLQRPAALVAGNYRLRLERARLLPAGTVVLAALLDHLRLPGIIVSPAGIREGIILAAAHFGDGWLEGSRSDVYAGRRDTTHLSLPLEDPVSNGQAAVVFPAVPAAMEPAALVAWQQIHDQVEAMLAYRKDAMSGTEDAIHDMRVAARKLRTTLEIFAPCFPARPMRRLNRAIKRLASALGTVRDADVALANLRQRLSEADPELAPGLRFLITRQVELRRNGRGALRSRLRPVRIDRVRELLRGVRLDPQQIVRLAAVRQPAPTNSQPMESGAHA